MDAKEAGDGTVPASRSAAKVLGKKFVHGFGDNRTHYGHQDSYSNPEVLSSTLYSLIKIANQAKWKKTDA